MEEDHRDGGLRLWIEWHKNGRSFFYRRLAEVQRAYLVVLESEASQDGAKQAYTDTLRAYFRRTDEYEETHVDIVKAYGLDERLLCPSTQEAKAWGQIFSVLPDWLAAEAAREKEEVDRGERPIDEAYLIKQSLTGWLANRTEKLARRTQQGSAAEPYAGPDWFLDFILMTPEDLEDRPCRKPFVTTL
jgi:hypothetical protein